MSGPSVVVDRAPDGWTHIGGPGMHLLIGLDEDDERTIAASDAADGGDIDDVVEVLTAGGMRKAHHFVGVHWQPQTRIVAFGPVSAVVTLADGSEHDVRATSSKVWTDLELPEHPERVVLRVLDESERSQPVPAQGLAGGPPGSDAVAPGSGGAASAASTDRAGGLAGQPDAVAPTDQHDQLDRPDQPADVVAGPASSAPGSSAEPGTASPSQPSADSSEDSTDNSTADSSNGASDEVPDARPVGGGIPTFGDVSRSAGTAAGSGAAGANQPGESGASGDPAGSNDSGRSPWDRSWARRDTPAVPPEAGTTTSQPASTHAPPPTVPAAQPAPAAPAAAAAPALRAWTSAAPPAPVRATPKTTPLPPQTSGPSDAAAAPLTTTQGQAPQPETGQPEAPQPDELEAAAPPAAAPQPVAAPSSPAPPAPSSPAPSSPAPSSPAPAVPAVPAVPVAGDLPAAEPRDVDSTWAARPLLEQDAAPAAAPSQASPASATSLSPAPGPQGGAGTHDPSDDEPAAALPSYDYLFGHTTTADEHRKALAQLTQPDDEDSAHDDEHLSVPSVTDVPDVPVTNAAPVPEVPERPLPSAPLLPETSEGGLISSVPWASPAPAAAPRPEVTPEVPTFSGRHTPPPAPSLLPPMNTPPPGARAPEATPLISMGPPPASPAPASPAPVSPAPPTGQAAQAPAAPSAPAPPAAYAPSVQPATEPSFDVPISLPTAPPAPPVSATPAPAATPAAPVVDAAPAADDDETELTVDRSALLEARNAAQNQTFSGPSVLAVLCSAGHPTPPHGDRCRVCGSSIPPQEPFTMPRPPLGVLRLSTGDVVTLDRSVLLGRAPRLGDGLAAHDRPHVVKVPSPERDISRNHVEVILEGWHVLIRDLGTTNGTTVTLPGESPMRLRANDQQVLEAGSRVSMADEVSFTFEAAL